MPKRTLKEVERELYAYKTSFDEIYWMARRYADGRSTYAPDMYNDALQRVMAFDFKPKPDPAVAQTYWARRGRLAGYMGDVNTEGCDADTKR